MTASRRTPWPTIRRFTARPGTRHSTSCMGTSRGCHWTQHTDLPQSPCRSAATSRTVSEPCGLRTVTCAVTPPGHPGRPLRGLTGSSVMRGIRSVIKSGSGTSELQLAGNPNWAYRIRVPPPLFGKVGLDGREVVYKVASKDGKVRNLHHNHLKPAKLSNQDNTDYSRKVAWVLKGRRRGILQGRGVGRGPSPSTLQGVRDSRECCCSYNRKNPPPKLPRCPLEG